MTLAPEQRWTVINGDCLEILPTFADKSVAHVITDPPYEAEAHTLLRRVRATVKTRSGGRTDAVRISPLSFAPISDEQRGWAAKEFARVSQRWTVAFCQVEAAMKWHEALSSAGAAVRRIGVWIKPDGMPQFSGDRPGMGYESIVFAHRKGKSVWNGGGRVAVFTHNKNTPGGARHHETQKPLPLMLELVELFTDPDDIILDPFCGSGTTLVAALRLGRRAIGIEKNPEYARVATERCLAEEQGQTLRQFRSGQIPLFAGVK